MWRRHLINSASWLPFAPQHDARSKRMRVGFKLKVRLIPQWSNAESPACICWLLWITFLFPPQAKYVSYRVVMWCADLWDIEEQCQCQAHPLCWVFPFQCNGVKINLSHDFISTRWWRDQLEASWCQTPSASPPVLNLKNQVCSTNLSRSVQQREQRRHCNTSLPSILVAGSLWSFLSHKYLKKRWVLDKCLWCSLKN